MRCNAWLRGGVLAVAILIFPCGCAGGPKPAPGPQPGPVAPTPHGSNGGGTVWPEPGPGEARVLVGGHPVIVKLALDAESRFKGLAGVESLSDHQGMLFAYPSTQGRSFWMKGCLMALDIAFLDEKGRVVSVHTMSPPVPGMLDADLPLASSKGPSRFVLEVAAGWFAARDLGVGTQVRLPAGLRAR